MALQKLNLDSSQVNEIAPIYLDGYSFDENDPDAWAKTGKDNIDRSSKYQLACILFSKDQMYLYSYLFDLTNNKKTERTTEYFYKDITGITTFNKTREKLVPGKGCLGFMNVEYAINKFLELHISVAGDYFACSMRTENETALKGMNSLLRDKKMEA